VTQENMSSNEELWRDINRDADAWNVPKKDRKDAWKFYYGRAVDKYYDQGPAIIHQKAEGMWQNYLCKFQTLFFLGLSTYIYS
jgi:hypothetical protein